MSQANRNRVLISFLSLIILIVSGVRGEVKKCHDTEAPITCHSARLLKNVVNHVIHNRDNSGTLELIPGLEIVESVDASGNRVYNNERSINNEIEDSTVIGRLTKYLQSHEMKIKFSEFLGKNDVKEIMTTAFKNIDFGKEISEARKKDKGGLGLVMMMGMMMAKMMAALGFGGVGMLALKALGVSMMALMLSAILGLKKLSDGGGHGGGHGGRQNVYYDIEEVHHGHGDEEHERRRRELYETYSPLPYKSWLKQYKR